VNDAAVEVAGLTVAFGQRRALEDVSFAAPGGCLVGVIGPNGAGKSTLFRAMLGVLPHAGTVRRPDRPAYVPQGEPGTGSGVGVNSIRLVRRTRTNSGWRTS